LAIHPDDAGRNFTTETFKGPLHHQVRNCLGYLRNVVVRTEVRKINGQAESKTISNYPFNALEEAISNAVYHKGYDEESPIEIQVFPDQITILSYPGPMPPITNADLQQRRVVSRASRNRRIGDFLKEIDLTEGKSTGFPIIRDPMAANGNPEPVFHTDKDQILFMVTLPCHPDLQGTQSVPKSVSKSGDPISQNDLAIILSETIDLQTLSNLLERNISEVYNQLRTALVSMSVPKSVSKSVLIIDFISEPKSRAEILKHIGMINHTKNFNAFIKPLIDFHIIELTIPDKPTSRLQKYRLTHKGRKLLKGGAT